MMRRVLKRSLAVLIILSMVGTVVSMSDSINIRAAVVKQTEKLTSCKYGIKGNGTGGIYIDINSSPYNKINYNGTTYGWLAYGPAGGTWYAAGRVTQLMNLKSPAGINAGPYWWRTTNNLNLEKGQEMKAPSVLCWAQNSSGVSHLAVLEKFSDDGQYAYISEGGAEGYSDADHGYAVIRQVRISDVTKCGDREFLGYVYLKGATAVPPAKPGPFSLSVKNQYNVSENISISWTASSNAQNYGLVVKDSAGKDVFNQKVTGTSRSIGMLEAGTYTVTMTPYNSAGSGTTARRTFTVVKSKPSAIKLTSKKQYTTAEDVVISWTKSENATVYLLVVEEANENGTAVRLQFKDNKITTTSQNINKIPAGYYRVQVTPYNTAGEGATVAGETIREYINVTAPGSAVEKPVPAESIRITVSYNANGGTGAPGSHAAAVNGTIASYKLSTAVPSRTGYKFLGWRLDNDGAYDIDSPGQSIAIDVGQSGTLVYYAQWEKAAESIKYTTYTITYVLNGGKNHSSNPSSYTQLSGVTLNNPVKTGYTFEGWYLDSGFRTKATGITKGSTGNKTFYAKWVKIASSGGSSSTKDSNRSLKVGADAWKTWSQKKSDNSIMRKSGCRVTAFAMMIAEAGYASDFNNPTEFYNILKGLKAFSGSISELGYFGDMVKKYASHNGGTASVERHRNVIKGLKAYSNSSKAKYSEMENSIMKDLKNGKYVTISTDPKMHTMYVMREKSLSEGCVWIADPANGSNYKLTKLGSKYGGRNIHYQAFTLKNLKRP